MDQPKISILMPSLNVAGFIRECMDSVLTQTLSDIEIICIDAGSSDGTWEILQEYASGDTRIRLVQSDRKSYGYQMNLGLAVARGEYIGIVETDDWVEPEMFKNLYSAAREMSADIVKANYYWYYTIPEKRNVPFDNLKRCQYGTVFRPRETMRLFETTPAIWSGIYRREMITEQDIRFNETPGASYQDASFHFMVCAVADRAVCLPQYLHHYRRDNENSSVNSPGKVYCVNEEMLFFERFLSKHSQISEEVFKPYMALKYEKYRWNYFHIAPKYQWDFLCRSREEFLRHRDDGDLDKSLFSSRSWIDLNEIMDSPVRYYGSTCKKYALRPRGSELPKPEILRLSRTETPDVTIIIPAFNAKDTILRTLTSASLQLGSRVEIICIDDGSTDSTLELLLAAADNDQRISVLHQVNEGLSSARNAGIQIARGRYILFLDTDDELREGALRYLVCKADEENPDIIYFDEEVSFEPEGMQEQNTGIMRSYGGDREPVQAVNGLDYIRENGYDIICQISSCMALYRAEYLRKSGIRFIDGILNEDNAFVFECLINADRIWHTNEALILQHVHKEAILNDTEHFYRFYGYLTSFERINGLMQVIPYDEALFTVFGLLLSSLCDNIRTEFNMLPSPDKDLEKLTETERFMFESLLARTQEEKRKKKKGLLNSVDFVFNSTLSKPAQKARRFMIGCRNDGLKKTVVRYVQRIISR